MYSKPTKVCSRCKAEKPTSDFHWHKTGKMAGKPISGCKDCMRVAIRDSRRKHAENHRAVNKAYREKHRDKFREIIRKNSLVHRIKRRRMVLDAYGGRCACCGEATPEFLSIDHINGGGSKHKREVKNHVYSWLVKHNFPKGFRLLCHNCNQSRGAYGLCPHEVASYDAPFAVRMED